VAQAYSQSTTISNVQANFIFSPLSWFLLVVIGLEIYAIFNLIHWMKFYTGIENYESTLTRKRINLWNKINAFQPMESESRIDVGHDYDGIRELDNITPPWFVAAFAGSILFAAVYMYRYHIAESAPLQIQEYEISVREAELNKLEDLKNQANFVDENSVTMLEAGQYEEGKSIYKMTCTVCHGDKGQGLVGPNITDEYWLHGGSMKDIFSTIKYGVLDKGMKSWKDDYSPNQIAQLASYIKSLKGTNPPEPKAAQGELYKEEIPVLKNPEMNKDSTNLSSNE
jgi:cytochrome c oxidase cbb3-type subunit 3